jgi:hypothetical protein
MLGLAWLIAFGLKTDVVMGAEEMSRNKFCDVTRLRCRGYSMKCTARRGLDEILPVRRSSNFQVNTHDYQQNLQKLLWLLK